MKTNLDTLSALNLREVISGNQHTTHVMKAGDHQGLINIAINSPKYLLINERGKLMPQCSSLGMKFFTQM